MPKIKNEELQLDVISPKGFPSTGISLYTDGDNKLKIRGNDRSESILASISEVEDIVKENSFDGFDNHVGEGISLVEGKLTLKKEYLDYLKRQTYINPTIVSVNIKDSKDVDISTLDDITREVGYFYNIGNKIKIQHQETEIDKIEYLRFYIVSGGNILYETQFQPAIIPTLVEIELDSDLTISTNDVPTAVSATVELVYRDVNSTIVKLPKSIFSFTTRWPYKFGKASINMKDFSEMYNEFTKYSVAGDFKFIAANDKNLHAWFCYPDETDPRNYNYTSNGFSVSIDIENPVEIVVNRSDYNTRYIYKCYRTSSLMNSEATVNVTRKS